MLFRTTILNITLLFCISCTSAPSSTTKPDILKSAYGDAFTMGVAINDDIIWQKDVDLSRIVTQHFNSVTAENVMKAEVILPTPGHYNFKPADAFVQFGLDRDMFIIGHTLVWHNQTPAWFFEDESGAPKTVEQQTEHMRHYIAQVAGRYQGKVDAWDVVNEVIGDDGQYRATTWVKSMGGGDELVKKAFTFASQYAPDAELYYNDFNAWRPAKVAGIVRMVKMLQAHNIRIDGIGIQGHWGLNYPDNQLIQDAIDAYSSLGVKVMITELDVDVLPLTKEGQIIGTGMLHPQYQNDEFKRFLDPYPNSLPQAIEKQYTERVTDLFRLFYRNRSKIDRVTFWGVHDSMSWKNDYPIANRTNYPLLFSRDKKAKPVVKQLINLP